MLGVEGCRLICCVDVWGLVGYLVFCVVMDCLVWFLLVFWMLLVVSLGLYLVNVLWIMDVGCRGIFLVGCCCFLGSFGSFCVLLIGSDGGCLVWSERCCLVRVVFCVC